MKIDKLLQKYGKTVHITGEDGWSTPLYHAFIQPLRYKTKLYMAGDVTPIGTNHNSVYLYIGPSNHDLTKLDKSHTVHDSQGNHYFIDRAEKIFIKDNVVYIWAVIRLITEGDE